MKLPLLLISCCTCIMIAGCTQTAQETETLQENNITEPREKTIRPETIRKTGNEEDLIRKDSQPVPGMIPPNYTHQGKLIDVSGGEASGEGEFGWNGKEFMLDVLIENVPPLKEGFFYEGWLVRKEPFEFVSTGPTEDEGGAYHSNSRVAQSDYSTFSQYVLTLEPDDGDPAPAKHILEGDLESIQ